MFKLSPHLLAVGAWVVTSAGFGAIAYRGMTHQVVCVKEVEVKILAVEYKNVLVLTPEGEQWVHQPSINRNGKMCLEFEMQRK